nr:diguanylate cyclase [Methylomarinum sp. Ch1-1]MDP4522612.1 diguanylate cyclase [Methylomarinum sp. Ch1-1]
MHEKLVYNATHDPVTQLINHKEFIKQFKRELSRLDGAQYVLCNIEIQDFRMITNTCGLAGGEALIKQLADLLKNQLHHRQILARLGDNTLAILLRNCSAEAAYDMARKLQSRLIDSHFEWRDKSYAIGASIGMLPFNDNSYDIASLLQKVDSATLSAKNAGRNSIRIFQKNDQMLKSQLNTHDWAGRIDQVLNNDRLFIRCQKIAAIDPQKRLTAIMKSYLASKMKTARSSPLTILSRPSNVAGACPK